MLEARLWQQCLVGYTMLNTFANRTSMHLPQEHFHELQDYCNYQKDMEAEASNWMHAFTIMALGKECRYCDLEVGLFFLATIPLLEASLFAAASVAFPILKSEHLPFQ